MGTILETIITSLGSGGVFGALGAGIGSLLKGRELAKQRAHELEMAKLQTDSERWKVMTEVQAQAEAGRSSERVASFQWSPAVQGASQWVVDIRSLFRPVLTIVLIAVATGLVVWTRDPELIRYGITTSVFMGGAAAGWWYAERGIKLPAQKHQ